uniref:Acetyltransferase n=1 Tax=Aegilops tauschii subsp. strangulata TaxID=200361 RepID=A0A452ZYY2_AEGTS
SEPRSTGDVRIVSRRMIRPSLPPEQRPEPEPEPESIHLTPWDLRMITLEYIQKGVLLPNAIAAGGVVERVASSLARALGRFYPFAGRLAATSPQPQSLAISLRCSGEGAEFVHAVAPGVTAADVAASLYIPRVVWSFFPLDGLLGADAVAGSRPVLAAQVTELADGVFIAMSLNHCVADGTTFWHFINTWSELSRRSVGGSSDDDVVISAPSPVFDRQWFLDSCPVPVPIPLPFGTVEDMVGKRVPQFPPVHECFLHFPAERVKELKAKANAEMAGTATTTISSLQALLAHLWRAVCRARRLAPEQKMAYYLLVGCRGRVDGIRASYAGNAVVAHASTASPAGEILGRGLAWAAWLLNRAVASFAEASAREKLARWPLEPSFSSLPALVATARAMVLTGSSPRFDVYGNDFGWGAPVAVRSGPANKLDGKATVYEGRGGQGSMALEVCLAPEALARLVADEEFMSAVATPGYL